MTVSTTRDDRRLAGLVGAIPGVRRLYSAHPTVVTVASSIVTAAGGTIAGGGPLLVTDTAVKVRIGIDDIRSTAQVGADVFAAVEAYFLATAPELSPTIEIEIATIR